MNKFLTLWSLLALRLAAADVSHLGIKYLPPMMISNNGFTMHHGNGHNGLSKQLTTTTIEKQYLHELPVQIEYGTQDATQYGGHMMPMINNMMTTMMMMKTNMKMPHDITKMIPTPAEYMQPPPMEQSVMPLYSEPNMLYLPPNMNYASTWQDQEQQKQQVHSMTSMPRTQYLPPRFMQPSQYQQMQQMQQMQEIPQMSLMSQMQTPMPVVMQAPLASEMPDIERQQMMEYSKGITQPAHMLTENGYQYKTGSSFPTSRTTSPAANKQRFRLRQ